MPTATRSKRGRPDTGVLATHQQISLYLMPALIEAVDQAATEEETETGRRTSRADVIRAAILEYLKARKGRRHE